MKKTILSLVALTVLVGGYSASAQFTSGRIVTIDLNKVFNDYYKTPIASAKLKETAQAYNKENENLVARYRKQIEELNALREDQDKPEYTDAVRAEKRKKVQEKLAETQKTERDIQEYRRTHQQELERQTQRMRQNILKEVTDVVSKEAKDAGYLYVFDKSGNTLNGVPGVVYAQESLDITDAILKILNRNAPADLPKSAPEKLAPDTK
jgi:Skp family chaperone for outer membrane proteins